MKVCHLIANQVTPLLYTTQSDGSLAELEETESDHDEGGDHTGNDTDPPVINPEVMPPEESSLPLRGSAC